MLQNLLTMLPLKLDQSTNLASEILLLCDDRLRDLPTTLRANLVPRVVQMLLRHRVCKLAAFDLISTGTIMRRTTASAVSFVSQSSSKTRAYVNMGAVALNSKRPCRLIPAHPGGCQVAGHTPQWPSAL